MPSYGKAAYNTIILCCLAILACMQLPSDSRLPIHIEAKSVARTPLAVQSPYYGAPTHCHSHNDEQHARPLVGALEAGCTSIEADVYAMNGKLYVGHSHASLRPSRTLQSMYLEPLLRLVDESNTNPSSTRGVVGVFSSQPWRSLVLVLDFKNPASDYYVAVLDKMLQPFKERDYLTYANATGRVEGPLTIVVGGSKPHGLVSADTDRRHVFYNLNSLPTDRFPNGQADRAYGLSLSFGKLVGTVYGRLSEEQLQKVRGQVHAAHDLGLSIRIWGAPKYAWKTDIRTGVQILMDSATSKFDSERWLPSPGYALWPWRTSLTEHVWEMLSEEGVDWIDVDDTERVERWMRIEYGKEVVHMRHDHITHDLLHH